MFKMATRLKLYHDSKTNKFIFTSTKTKHHTEREPYEHTALLKDFELCLSSDTTAHY